MRRQLPTTATVQTLADTVALSSVPLYLIHCPYSALSQVLGTLEGNSRNFVAWPPGAGYDVLTAIPADGSGHEHPAVNELKKYAPAGRRPSVTEGHDILDGYSGAILTQTVGIDTVPHDIVITGGQWAL